MNCLVTGGAGFIGSHIVESLVERGDRVTVLDNLTTGNQDNLSKVADRITFIKGDIRDQDSLDAAVKDIAVIFHLAAHISVAESMLIPSTTFDINVMGTNLLFQTACKHHVRKIVLSSSAAVYGDQTKLPIHETAPLAPLSPYGASKQMDEELAGLYTRSFQLPVTCLRYFNAYGPRQNPDSPYSAAIPIFIRKLLKGESPVIYGDGGQTRDFLYVGDIVRANLMAADNPTSDGRILNICGGAPITILELARLLRVIIPGSPEEILAPSRSGDIYHSYGDPGLARELLGFNTQMNFADGLRATVDWMRS